MRISLGNFGQMQAQTTPVQFDSSGEQRAIQMIGGAFLEKQRQTEEIDAAENAKFLAQYGNAIQDISAQLTADVNSGSVRADDYSDQFSQRTKEWRDKSLIDLPERRRQALAPALDLYEIQSKGRAQAAQIALVQDARQAIDNSTLDDLLKQSQMDPDGAIQQGSLVIEANPNWSAQEKAELGTKFADRARFSNRDLWIENQTNIGSLRKERQTLLDGAYGELTPQSRRTLVERAEQRIAELDAKIRTAQNAEELESAKIAKEVTSAKLQGYKVSPEADLKANQIISKYSGKPWADELADANKDAAAMRNMAMRPITTQGVMVAEAKANIAKKPAEEVGAAVDRLQRLENAYKSNVKFAQENPWGYYAAVNGEDSLPPPLTFDETLPEQMVIRNERAQLVQAGVGINPGIFLPNEVPAVVKLIDSVPAEQKLNLLAQMAVYDKATSSATFDSIGKQKPVYGMAGKLHSLGGSVNGRPAADLMLKGQIALESKAVQIGDKSNLSMEISDRIGQIFADNPQDFATAKEAVTWVVAGMAQSRGEFKLDVADPDDVEAAINATINPVEVRSRTVSAPIGMDKDDFHDQIVLRLDQAITKAKISDDNKVYLRDDATLRDAPGDGMYYMAWPDGRLVYDQNQNPVVVSLK